jgi:RNA polymerase sigma-70 factor (ECF subfamily)
MGSPAGEVPLDDDLLRRCQQGDRPALGELICRFRDRLFRLAFRVLRDAARAEDAVADAFAAVWFRCGNWRGEAAAAWIHRVAYRVVLDHARTRRRWWRFFRREPEEPPASPEPGGDPGEREQRQRRARRLDAAIAALSPEDRALVHLHYFENQSLAEIAVVLGTSRDALKMRLSRARARLRELLGDGDELL